MRPADRPAARAGCGRARSAASAARGPPPSSMTEHASGESLTVAAWLSVTFAACTIGAKRRAVSRTGSAVGSTGGPSSAVTTNVPASSASRRRLIGRHGEGCRRRWPHPIGRDRVRVTWPRSSAPWASRTTRSSRSPWRAARTASARRGGSTTRSPSELRAMNPDTIVIVTTDHYNLFFEVSVPIFCIGVAERAAGPCDYPQLPRVDVALDAELAREIQASVVARSSTSGASREPELDHTITAPLCSMLGTVDVRARSRSTSAARCTRSRARGAASRSGAAVRRAIERSPLARRVVVVGSGAFSFEVGGPRMSEDSHVGVPDPGVGRACHRAARRRRLRPRRGRGDAGTAGGRRQRVRRAPRLARDARHLRRTALTYVSACPVTGLTLKAAPATSAQTMRCTGTPMGPVAAGRSRR